MQRWNLPASMLLRYPGDFLDLPSPVDQNGAAMQDPDAFSPRPKVPWALVLLIVWCAVQATVFTFTLPPTGREVLAELIGVTVNPIPLVVLLWMFLTIIIAGRVACVHALTDAVSATQIGNI